MENIFTETQNEELQEVAPPIEQVRFSDASWYKAGPKEFIIGGAGTISSWLALFLARIGHTIHIYDFDVLEEHNMAGQFYSGDSIGNDKVSALNELIDGFTNSQNYLNVYSERYTKDSMATPIMLSGFDNMEARKTMFENWRKQEDREILIEARLSAEQGQIFAVTKENEERYLEYLYSDGEVPELPCSFKSTSHCGALIGSLMTSILNNYISNDFTKNDIREVPFITSFDLVLLNVELTF